LVINILKIIGLESVQTTVVRCFSIIKKIWIVSVLWVRRCLIREGVGLCNCGDCKGLSEVGLQCAQCCTPPTCCKDICQVRIVLKNIQQNVYIYMNDLIMIFGLTTVCLAPLQGPGICNKLSECCSPVATALCLPLCAGNCCQDGCGQDCMSADWWKSVCQGADCCSSFGECSSLDCLCCEITIKGRPPV